MIRKCIQDLSEILLKAEEQKNAVAAAAAAAAAISNKKSATKTTMVTNMDEALIDMFYATSSSFNNNDDDDDDEEEEEVVEVETTNNGDDDDDDDVGYYKTTTATTTTTTTTPIYTSDDFTNKLQKYNPVIAEYVERNEYERVLALSRRRKEEKQRIKSAREPKCISNHGLHRMFQATTYEHCCDEVMDMIRNGTIPPATDDNVEGFKSHPSTNCTIDNYFNATEYEGYLSILMLQPVFTKMYGSSHPSLKTNPRYPLIVCASLIEPLDRKVLFGSSDRVSTFKAVLYNVLNAHHFAGSLGGGSSGNNNNTLSSNEGSMSTGNTSGGNKNTLKEIVQAAQDGRFLVKPVVVDDGDDDNGNGSSSGSNNHNQSDDVVAWLNHLIRCSVYALYILTINNATKNKVELRRIGYYKDLYVCNQNPSKKLLMVRNESTVYYAAKEKIWIFRRGRAVYHHDNLNVVFHHLTL